MPSFCLIVQVDLKQGSVTVNHVKSWGNKKGRHIQKLHKQNVRWWDCLSGHKVWCVSGTANSTEEHCFIRPVSRNLMDWTGSLNWVGDTRLPTLVLCLLMFICGSVLKEKKTCSTSTLMWKRSIHVLISNLWALLSSLNRSGSEAEPDVTVYSSSLVHLRHPGWFWRVEQRFLPTKHSANVSFENWRIVKH